VVGRDFSRLLGLLGHKLILSGVVGANQLSNWMRVPIPQSGASIPPSVASPNAEAIIVFSMTSRGVLPGPSTATEAPPFYLAGRQTKVSWPRPVELLSLRFLSQFNSRSFLWQIPHIAPRQPQDPPRFDFLSFNSASVPHQRCPFFYCLALSLSERFRRASSTYFL